MNNESNYDLSTFDAQHDRVWENLPWFANNTLGDEERRESASHLSICLVCRREVDGLKALHEAMASRNLEPQCESALDRLHERLDESTRATPAVPWAAAAVLAIVTGLAGLININSGLMGSVSGNNAYMTLGARTTQLIDNKIVTARIVFDEGVTEFQLRELLLSAEAEMVDGPTARGAYTIAMPKVRRGEDLQAAVAKLRDSDRVLFVEPIIGLGN